MTISKKRCTGVGDTVPALRTVRQWLPWTRIVPSPGIHQRTGKAAWLGASGYSIGSRQMPSPGCHSQSPPSAPRPRSRTGSALRPWPPNTCTPGAVLHTCIARPLAGSVSSAANAVPSPSGTIQPYVPTTEGMEQDDEPITGYGDLVDASLDAATLQQLVETRAEFLDRRADCRAKTVDRKMVRIDGVAEQIAMTQ